MKLNELRKIIKESLLSVMSERKKQSTMVQRMKSALRPVIAEALEEKKREFDKTLVEIEENLQKEVKKINKSYEVKKNDAGNFEICGCEPHHVDVRPMWTGKFDVIIFKDKSDRTKKIALDFDDVKEFLKKMLSGDEVSYVDKAFNKSAENSKDKESKKNSGDEPQETKEKVIDAVKDKEDLPDQPFKEIDIDKLDKQSDHSVKGTKPKYKAPKSVSDKLTVKS